jgi:hypothetical protein
MFAVFLRGSINGEHEHGDEHRQSPNDQAKDRGGMVIDGVMGDMDHHAAPPFGVGRNRVALDNGDFAVSFQTAKSCRQTAKAGLRRLAGSPAKIRTYS